jgi:hypothetical protein
MRVRKLNDADTLQILSVGYRMQRVMSKEYGLRPLDAAIVTLIGSYSNRPTDEILSLSVPEIITLLSYSKTNKERIYYATKELCAGNEPYLKMHKVKGKATTYSLTAKGVDIVRKAIELSKVFRFEISQVAA